jgi:hypothetical protein
MTLAMASIMIFKKNSLYNIGHNKRKELLPTKFQFKVKNLTLTRIIDVVSTGEKDLLIHLQKLLCSKQYSIEDLYLSTDQ